MLNGSALPIQGELPTPVGTRCGNAAKISTCAASMDGAEVGVVIYFLVVASISLPWIHTTEAPCSFFRSPSLHYTALAPVSS